MAGTPHQPDGSWYKPGDPLPDRRPNPILAALDWTVLLNGLPHVVDVPGLPGQWEANMASIRAKAYRMGRRIPVIVETKKVSSNQLQIKARNPFAPHPGGLYYWVQKQLWGLPQETAQEPEPVIEDPYAGMSDEVKAARARVAAQLAGSQEVEPGAKDPESGWDEDVAGFYAGDPPQAAAEAGDAPA